VLGCDHSIRKFKEDGTPVWTAATTSPVWSVNLAKKGAMVVAAMGDGTIRWIRYEDHRELIILYVKQERTKYGDSTKWAVWTHEGYFDCSPDAENVAGLSVSAGPGASPDFFPMSCFRDTYYRPDVIQKVLATHDVEEAAKQANKESKRPTPPPTKELLPPVVRIANELTSDSAGNGVTVRYALRTPSGEAVKRLVFQVDGRPVKTLENLDLKSDSKDATGEVKLDMEGGETVSVVAQNGHAWSVPSSAEVRYRGIKGQKQQLTAGKGTLYILAAGVNQTATRYSNLAPLKFPAKDASDFLKAIDAHRGTLFENVVTRLRTNEGATARTLREDLAAFLAGAKRHDVIVVFLGGHGLSNSNFDYRYIPFDYDPKRPDETSITRQDLEKLTNSQASVLFFIDTCHAGRAAPSGVANDVTRTINGLAAPERGAIVYSACAGYQAAAESDSWGNGAFTMAAVEGISGKADYAHEGKVMTDMIGPYITRRVAIITGDPDAQTPCVSHPPSVRDFAIAVVGNSGGAKTSRR
jgi:hypothetical protein